MAVSEDLQNHSIKDAKTIREDLVESVFATGTSLKPPVVNPVIRHDAVIFPKGNLTVGIVIDAVIVAFCLVGERKHHPFPKFSEIEP